MKVFTQLFFCLNIFAILIIVGCKSETETNNNNVDSTNTTKIIEKTPEIELLLVSPISGTRLTVGDTVEIEVIAKSSEPVDSIVSFINNVRIGCSKTDEYSDVWVSEGKVGKRKIKILAYKLGLTVSKTTSIILKSDIVPRKINYKLINRHPHDPLAYTQGLIYEDGILYEGTGQLGESSLRKVNLKSGEIEQVYSLPSDVFGEGIVIHGDKIFQLTYRAKTVYVYDKKSFRLLTTFAYDTYEGWGITNYKENFIMSDGATNIFYIIEPQFFAEVGQLEVYNNKGSVNKLNELEYIDGKIYANIYLTTQIVEIDPETGKITGIIELKDLVPKEHKNDNYDNVLNGIAYDSTTGHLFVTGKRWPVLYEIELSK